MRQGARPRELEELGDRVDADDVAHERRERERQRAGPGADVEGVFVAGWTDEVAHLLTEQCGTAILADGDPLRRAREPLSR
jgi:hypothetical protein